jgi:hypothetical protein
MSKVFYGISPEEIFDVTEIALRNCMQDQTLVIPAGDPERSILFECDPYYGQLKSVFIVGPDGSGECYDHMTPVDIPNFV